MAEVVTFLVEFVTAANEFIKAINYIFQIITLIINMFQGIKSFIDNVLPRIYELSQTVPSWLWVIPLGFISWRLVMFCKNLGGN